MRARVTRVSGSLVEVEDLRNVSMFDVVALGERQLRGEIVSIADGRITIQAYEDTGGLAPGASVVAEGAPLSARLGPGLLGGIFDGLLRPLTAAGTWLAPGGELHMRDTEHCWSFTPSASSGTSLKSGDEIGVVGGEGALPLRVLVPPGLCGRAEIIAAGTYPEDKIIASVGGVDITMVTTWPVRRVRPFHMRIDDVEGLHTGQRVLDLLVPIARGGTAAVPGGFGTGKTVLLQQIAKWCDADVIVYVGCGERGNEMADVVDDLEALEDPRTGDRLTRRTVVIANTSNMPMMAREASIHTGVTVAEYFRDMGYHVVVIADSTSRWAEALREFSSRTGALPVEEGYPAGLASALADFYARAGHVVTLGGRRGSVTIIGAVSPSGGDMTEPVTAHTQRFVRCLWTLDRDLAYARHYPAVSWAVSFSLDSKALGLWHRRGGDPDWGRRRARITAMLAESDRLTSLAELVGVEALPDAERIAILAGRLLREAVLQQNALSANDAFCSAEKGAALVDAVLVVVEKCSTLVTAGVSAAVIGDVDFGPLIRSAQECASDDAEGVRGHRQIMLARLGELE